MAFINDLRPLSRILLCPISRNSKDGELATIFYATARAPSYAILLLKRLRYFRDLLFFKATES